MNYKIIVIGGSESGKSNAPLNLIHYQEKDDNDYDNDDDDDDDDDDVTIHMNESKIFE